MAQGCQQPKPTFPSAKLSELGSTTGMQERQIKFPVPSTPGGTHDRDAGQRRRIAWNVIADTALWQTKGVRALIGEADFPDSSSRRGPSMVSAESPATPEHWGWIMDGSATCMGGVAAAETWPVLFASHLNQRLQKRRANRGNNAVSLGHWGCCGRSQISQERDVICPSAGLAGTMILVRAHDWLEGSIRGWERCGGNNKACGAGRTTDVTVQPYRVQYSTAIEPWEPWEPCSHRATGGGAWKRPATATVLLPLHRSSLGQNPRSSLDLVGRLTFDGSAQTSKQTAALHDFITALRTQEKPGCQAQPSRAKPSQAKPSQAKPKLKPSRLERHPRPSVFIAASGNSRGKKASSAEFVDRAKPRTGHASPKRTMPSLDPLLASPRIASHRTGQPPTTPDAGKEPLPKAPSLQASSNHALGNFPIRTSLRLDGAG
ncbi:hypothetical protein NA56DRAFT_701197 [Hyaloscypha hepaticicola]|uniref:Uncharacterized protein n=1 Tax=Hyaloscypha hepaticicola TaxID=2082293 RepID=A0A2J6QC18_9HELO|nr:hypothetical protein NA56DRAFT_701197 [Hyaloscypha hepaticicola]